MTLITESTADVRKDQQYIVMILSCLATNNCRMMRLRRLVKFGGEIQIRFSTFYPVPYPFRIPNIVSYFTIKILKKILEMHSAGNVTRFIKVQTIFAPSVQSKKAFAINACIFEKKPLNSSMESVAKCLFKHLPL